MMNIKIFLTFFLFIFACVGASVSGAQPLLDQPNIENSSFRPGEVLEYNAKVRGISAGTQIMQVNGRKLIDGYEVYHVESVSSARKIFSVFYPFSNRSESFIHSEELYPLQYKRNIRDGGYSGSTAVEFDPVNQVARIVKDQKSKELQIPEGIQDELSMIYLLRNKKIEVGHRYEFPALVGTKTLKATVAVLRKERIKTVLGTLKTIVVKTIPRGITMWLTDDSARIPVRIEASTKLGKLVFNLKEMH